MTPAQRLAELRDAQQPAAFNTYAYNTAHAIAQRERELEEENARLKAVIAEHELCHENGQVTAECFAKSCIAYQRQKFGHSPTEEQLAAKDAEIARLKKELADHITVWKCQKEFERTEAYRRENP